MRLGTRYVRFQFTWEILHVLFYRYRSATAKGMGVNRQLGSFTGTNMSNLPTGRINRTMLTHYYARHDKIRIMK